MKKLLYSTLFLLITTSLFSFGINEEQINATEKIVVGLILNNPGLADNSSNDDCYNGLVQAADEGLITIRTKTATDIDHSIEIINEFVEDKVHMIFAIGDVNRKLLLDASKIYPKTIFVGVDILFKTNELKANVFGITFKEQDGGYLAGLLAGSMSYRFNKKHESLNEINKVGIILGKNNPDIKRYEVGFYAGVKNINPACEVISVNINDLDNPEKANKALKGLKQKGVDVVFSVAGNSDIGVFEAAKELNVLVIAANKDKNEVSDIILTSVVKKISVSTYLMTKQYLEGMFETGQNNVYGLNEGAISLAPYYNYDRYIPKEVRTLIKKQTLKLSKGSIEIPNTIPEIIFDVTDIPEIAE